MSTQTMVFRTRQSLLNLGQATLDYAPNLLRSLAVLLSVLGGLSLLLMAAFAANPTEERSLFLICGLAFNLFGLLLAAPDLN